MTSTSSPQRNPTPLVTALAGGLAGLTSRFCIAPLDVVKIRLQLQSRPKTYFSSLHAVRTILAQEGITALWKGNIPAELLYVSYSMVQFVTYRESLGVLEKAGLPEGGRSFVAGGMAGMAATVVTYPLDLLRTRFAAQGTTKVYLSVMQSVRDILHDEGFKGYYRGLPTSLLQIAPYMAILFSTYETTRKTLTTHNLTSPATASFVAGGFAGILSKCTIFPLDTIRKRLQVQGPTLNKYIHRDIPVYNGITHCVRSILRDEGVRGFYKGLGVALVKSGPSAAITLWVFDGSLRVWEWITDRPGRGGMWHD